MHFFFYSLAGHHSFTKSYRKDDYAFFLTPVDASAVPGYAEAVKRPMDFGTMTTKVSKGKYRSLEEFAVSINLKIFRSLH